MAKNFLQLPRQHGAYAILLIPLTAGLVKAANFTWGQVALTGAWIGAYLSFYQLSLYWKTRSPRRQNYRVPLFAYLLGTAFFSALTLWARGWGLLGWVAILAAPGIGALYCLKTHAERSVRSGAFTTFVSCTMALVAAYPTPLAWLAADSTVFTCEILATFGYFFGSVLHVKALIRERGQHSARQRSLVWHLFSLLVISALYYFQLLSWIWVLYAGIWLGRTALLLYVDRRRPRRLPARKIGITEMLCCLPLWVTLLF